MKQLLTIIFLLLFSIANSQNETIGKTTEVIYTKAYKNYKDTTNSTPKFIKNLEYQLLFNINEARFEYIPNMQNDSNKNNERFIGKGGGKGIYYKNLKEGRNIKAVSSYETHFLIQEDFNKFEWSLLKEAKKILGYDCFKAIGKYKEYNYFLKKEQVIDVVVWYTPNIPISFGPSGYDGVPGLVLESYRSSFHFIATKLIFHDKNLKISEPNEGEVVSLEEYNKILNENWIKKTKQK